MAWGDFLDTEQIITSTGQPSFSPFESLFYSAHAFVPRPTYYYISFITFPLFISMSFTTSFSFVIDYTQDEKTVLSYQPPERKKIMRKKGKYNKELVVFLESSFGLRDDL